jgi:hypothetical protein
MSYNVELDLKYVESKLTYFIYMIGLNPDNLDSLTIDVLIEKARLFSLISNDSVPYDSNIQGKVEAVNSLSRYKDEPAIAHLRNQRISVVANIRRFWYLRQLALGAINRG